MSASTALVVGSLFIVIFCRLLNRHISTTTTTKILDLETTLNLKVDTLRLLFVSRSPYLLSRTLTFFAFI